MLRFASVPSGIDIGGKVRGRGQERNARLPKICEDLAVGVRQQQRIPIGEGPVRPLARSQSHGIHKIVAAVVAKVLLFRH